MHAFLKIIFIFYLLVTSVKADEATDWLGNEIDTILDAYKNTQISKVERFALIEETYNHSFSPSII